ncbi:type VI secretion system Vgr family protein [Noviherbaspirillum sp.]|uniref:type VI secretion system Vgr family protein n=1 Tax=Noviherbaspirillum sp. TaxID=1926288 RepID=UPI002FE32340
MAKSSRIFFDGTDQSGKLDLVSVRASEQLGQTYQFDVTVLSDRTELTPRAALGKTFGAEVLLPDGSYRRFNGIIVRMGRGAQYGARHEYWFEIQPDLALLARRTDARIFQNKTVPEVVDLVLAKIASLSHQFSASSLKHLPWECCTQYMETDLAFVQRLLEQEGIYFYFEHLGNGRTALRLLDDNATSYQLSRPMLQLSFNPNAFASDRSHDYVENWQRVHDMVSGQTEIGDYDFTKPMQAAHFHRKNQSGHQGDDFDLFFYPGEFDTLEEGETYARLRMEQIHAQYAACEGTTASAAVQIGRIIRIKDHPLADMNGEFLVVSTAYSFKSHAYAAGHGEGSEMHCSFIAIPAGVQFRSQRRTPASRIVGPQTALVVGPEQQEIHTDQYGRIRVMFHWDRYGKPTEDTSCWIRVAQPWANQGFGFWALPRVGSEVVVHFLEGDPDRPIVTGSVYNGENQIPYPQPAKKTSSGMRTYSTPDGGANDYNELRFEDMKGEEELYIQAQKDMNTRIKANATRIVGNNDSVSVDANQNIRVQKNRNVTVDGKQATSIGSDRHMAVSGNESKQVTGDRVMQLGSDSVQIDGDAICSTGGSLDISAGQSYALSAQMNIAMTAQSAVDIKSGMSVALDAGTGVCLRCGSSFISLTPAGIFIQGPQVMINSGGAPVAAKPARPARPKAVNKAPDADAIAVAESPPVKPATQQPRAGSLANAARAGAPFAAAG